MNELPIYDTSLKLCVHAPCWPDGISVVCLFLCRMMELCQLFCLLISAASLTFSGALAQHESADTDQWIRQSLPVLLDTHTEYLKPAVLGGQKENEEQAGTETFCGIECQSSRPPMDQEEQERTLGYETMYENGTRTLTDVRLVNFNRTLTWQTGASPTHIRRKRQVYGEDGRFVISDSHYITNYPFSSAVRVSRRCSGILISPKHVLTAAHCIHNGREFLTHTQRVRVGVLQLKSKKGEDGQRRRRGNKEDKSEKQVVEEGVEQNTVAGDVKVGRQGVKTKRRRGQTGMMGTAGRGGKRKRLKRAAESKRQPVFRWAQVKHIQIPQGWSQDRSSTNSLSADYDYAVLELRHPVRQKYMELGVAPSEAPMTRIHFSGYDADKSLHDGGGGKGKVVYRFCSVVKESADLLYQHCDAQPEATGAGVYVRLRQEAEDTDGKGKWQRRVIGVFSGHQQVETEGGEQRDYNVAVRITPLKYAQICHWIHTDPSLCKEI